MNTNLNLQNYESLRRAGLLERSAYGQLRLAGADRADFLQRMTTNNMGALRPGQAAVTVLTSATARILFVFTVLCREEDLLLLPAGADQRAALARHLRGQIFFMDKVTVHLEPELVRLRVVGSEAGARLAGWASDAAEMSDDAFILYDDVLILRQDRLDVPGYELLCAPANEAGLRDALQHAGFTAVEDADAYTALRVEMGRGATQGELVADYTPLEVGLAWTCAENKGCYTGQEIIARQITYDKVTKGLTGIALPTPTIQGTTVLVDGKSVGTVTSVAYSPARESFIALAVVRRGMGEPGQAVDVRTDTADDDNVVAGEVIELPLDRVATAARLESN